MNDNTTLAQQMVVAAPAATRNVNLPSGAGVGTAHVAPFISSQKDIRDCVI
ncbi:hypothetical protein GCM10027346_19830 [Hymenobacter seoulensis]